MAYEDLSGFGAVINDYINNSVLKRFGIEDFLQYTKKYDLNNEEHIKAFKEKYGFDARNMNDMKSETYSISSLSSSLDEVIEKVKEKNELFETEQSIVSTVTDSEVSDLNRVRDAVNEISEAVERKNKLVNDSTTLPQEHTYPESIGYDFERIKDSSEDNVSASNDDIIDQKIKEYNRIKIEIDKINKKKKPNKDDNETKNNLSLMQEDISSELQDLGMYYDINSAKWVKDVINLEDEYEKLILLINNNDISGIANLLEIQEDDINNVDKLKNNYELLLSLLKNNGLDASNMQLSWYKGWINGSDIISGNFKPALNRLGNINGIDINYDTVIDNTNHLNNAEQELIETQKELNNVQEQSPFSPTQTFENMANEEIEYTKKQIKGFKDYIFNTNSDECGLFAKYLFGEDGNLKTEKQVIAELETMIDEFYKGTRTDTEEIFRLWRAAESTNLLKGYNFDYKWMRPSFEEWRGNHDDTNQWLTRTDEMSDEAHSMLGHLVEEEEKLSILQKNNGEDFVNYLREAKELSEEIYQFLDKYENYSPSDKDSILDSDITQEQAKEKGDLLEKESDKADDLIKKYEILIEKYSEFKKNSNISDIENDPLGRYGIVNDLKDLSDKLFRESGIYSDISLLRRSRKIGGQLDIYENDPRIDRAYNDKKLYPFAERIDTEIYRGTISAQEGIEKFIAKAKELGYTFDEDANKWIKLEEVVSSPIQETAIENVVDETKERIKELERELENLASSYKISFRDDATDSFEFENNYKIANRLKEILTELTQLDPNYSIEDLISRTTTSLNNAKDSAKKFSDILKEVRKGTGKWSKNKIINDPTGFANDFIATTDEYKTLKENPEHDKKELLNVEARLNAMLSAQHQLLIEESDFCKNIFAESQKIIRSNPYAEEIQDMFWEGMANGANMSSRSDLEYIVKDRLGIHFGDIADDFQIERIQDLLDLLNNIDKVQSKISKESMINDQQKLLDDSNNWVKLLSERLRNTPEEDRLQDPEWVENQYKFIAEYMNNAEKARAKIAELNGEVYEFKELTSEDIKSTFWNTPLSSPDESLELEQPGVIKVKPNLDPHEFAQEVTDLLKETSADINVEPSPDLNAKEFTDKVTTLLSGHTVGVDVELNNSKSQESVNDESIKLDTLGDSLDEITRKVNGKTMAFVNEKGEVDKLVNIEAQRLTDLKDTINEVTVAVDKKTDAFKNEGSVVKDVVDSEKKQLKSLMDRISTIAGYVEDPNTIPIVTPSQPNQNNNPSNNSNINSSQNNNQNNNTNNNNNNQNTNNNNNKKDIDDLLSKQEQAYKRQLKLKKDLAKLDSDKNKEQYLEIERQEKEQENLVATFGQRIQALDSTFDISKRINDLQEKYKSTLDDIVAIEKSRLDIQNNAISNTNNKNIKNTINTIDKLIESLSKLNEKSDEYPIEYSIRIQKVMNDLKDARRMPAAVIDKEIKGFKKVISEIRNMDKLPNDTREADNNSISKLTYQISNFMKNNSRMSKESKAELQGLIDKLNKVGLTVHDLKEVSNAFNEMKTNIIQAGLAGNSLFDTFKRKIITVTAQQIATYFSFNDIIRYGRTAAQTVINLNTQFTELAKVSDTSIKQLERDFTSYASTAKEVGGTISDTISATADWARMGYNLPDSKELARVALIYKNVGDGIDISTANESLISTLQGFQMEATDAMEIIDKFNEVSNNFAISSSGIGEALKRSAASFNASGTSLSKSIALVTSANTVLQNPEQVGTIWKTMSARLRGAKTELEDLGEEEDEFTESTSKLKNLVKSLTGFDIMKDKDTFKDIYDIMIGIGEKWDDLTDVEQASLGEALAGKRNANALYAVLNNIDTLKDAYKTAEESEGSAMREQLRYQESIQYSIDRVKASFEEFASSVIDSGLLKYVIDLSNAFVNVATAITKIGNSIPIIGSIAKNSGTAALLGGASGMATGIMNKGPIAHKQIGDAQLVDVFGIFKTTKPKQTCRIAVWL